MLRASEQKIQWILLENRCFFENLRQDRLSRQIPNVSGYSIQSSGGGSYFSGGGGSNWRNNGGNDWRLPYYYFGLLILSCVGRATGHFLYN